MTAEPEKKPRKIAIIGTAPQWQLAPFDDPTWEIWGIFGVVGCGKRLDRIYELHDKSIIEPMAAADQKKEYWKHVSALGKNYITKDAYEQAPDATRFDFQTKLDKYGRYFTSSAAWLIADAIDEGATEIGMWGINMASDSEYAHQKPGCTFLLGWARAKGIKITLPASSELLTASHQYGYEPPPRLNAIIAQKRAELNQQLSAHKNNFEATRMGVYGTEQALVLLDYIEKNWK
jgi:hypothetical protein